MRELCIACNKSNAQMLDDLHKYLTITSHQIVTNFADDNFNYILFADTTNFNCVFQLKNAFLNYFVNEFKYQYILQKIGIQGDFFYQACVKVLTLFDRETDEQFLLSDMTVSGKVYLDSYAEFRLALLKKRWDEVADLARDNRFYYLPLADRGEILHFLVSTMTKNAHVGIIKRENGKYVFIFDKHTEVFDTHSRLELVTSVVRVCPAKIKLDGSLDEELGRFFRLCFAERVIK